MTLVRRLAAVETSLSPTQLVLRWLDEAHAFGDLESYVRSQLTEPAAEGPLDRLAREAVSGVRASLRGKHAEVVGPAIRSALRETVFRFDLVIRILVTTRMLAIPQLLEGGRLGRLHEQLNPPDLRSAIHPGYKWGHGTKVLSLFVRDLVACSRYFTDDEARRIEWWLYCPLDTVVMDKLRRVGFDPLVHQINQIDEAAFWRIQNALSISAEDAGVPRIWFDDVWSEDRH